MRAEDAQTATAPRATPARDAAIAALEQYRGARGAGGRVEAWHDLPAAAVVDVVLASAAGPETDPVLFEVTDRGFRRYEPIPTAYGHVVSVYESSAASEPCVWLEIDANSATAGPDGDLAAHLRDQDAEALIRTLRQALGGHYQRRLAATPTTSGGAS